MGLGIIPNNGNVRSFAIILVIVAFSISMIVPAVANSPWQEIVVGSVSITTNSPNTTELSIQSPVPYPPSEKIKFAGFGWLYEDGTSAFAITTHNGIRDSTQRPDGWHAHNVVIAAASTSTPGVSHCITAIDDHATGGVAINQDTLRGIYRNDVITGTFLDPPTAISFDILPDAECPLGVGIGILQVEPAPPAEEEKKGGNPNK